MARFFGVISVFKRFLGERLVLDIHIPEVTGLAVGGIKVPGGVVVFDDTDLVILGAVPAVQLGMHS
jgi:hypothetical protein